MTGLNFVILAFLCGQNQILHNRSNAAVRYFNIVEFVASKRVADNILERRGNYVYYAVTKESLHGIIGLLVIMLKCGQFHGDRQLPLALYGNASN